MKDYLTAGNESRTLIQTQLQDPKEAEGIKASIQSDSEIADAVSLKVKDIYEDNPYPRYRYADHTVKSLAKTPSEVIKIESTKDNLQFSDELIGSHLSSKVLIPGCGTGDQIILASLYKNAQITAIDLSSSSLIYATRKAKDYAMNNVSFRKIDLLKVADLDDTFDII